MKFNANRDFDNYSPDLAGYFSLKNDGDTARVRFLYEDLNDVEGYCVHRVKDKTGRFHYVDCIRGYSDPLDQCPFCSSPNMEDRKTQAKLWVPLYKVDEGKAVLWDRGKSFYKQLSAIMVEKGGSPFCSHVFTIERHGAAGDFDTTYELVDDGEDETVLDDILAEIETIPTPEGTIVLQKSFEEMQNFVQTRTFNKEDASEEDDMPIRRREASNEIPRRRGTTRPDV